MIGWLQAAAVIVIVGVVHVPLGDYMARVYTSARHSRAEKAIYRLIGVAPDEEQKWTRYLGSLLAFSVMGILVLYGLLLLQRYLPQPWGHKGMDPPLAFNTAVSFTTNTSWQNSAGESSLGHLGLAAGLGVEAFASAAVSMCVAIALVRGLARRETDRLGNFWVDLVRSCVPRPHGCRRCCTPSPVRQRATAARSAGSPVTRPGTTSCSRWPCSSAATYL
ncbi:MAG: K+-transporting ATPase, KdpA [Streptosporangiaceae bacterium]|nr:K+-transporting ATPase, KdpA [Streptosporangiaceae bacterium]